jgi:hypothetical protein
VLAWSRDEQCLRKAIKEAKFLSEEDRRRREKKGILVDEITIVHTPIGDKLQIENNYSFLAASYLRDHFVGLCDSAKAACKSPECEEKK